MDWNRLFPHDMIASFLFPSSSQDCGFARGNGQQYISEKSRDQSFHVAEITCSETISVRAWQLYLRAINFVGTRLIKLTFSMRTLIWPGTYFLMERQYPTEPCPMEQIFTVNYLIILAENLFEAQAKAVWNASLEKTQDRICSLGLRMSQMRRI